MERSDMNNVTVEYEMRFYPEMDNEVELLAEQHGGKLTYGGATLVIRDVGFKFESQDQAKSFKNQVIKLPNVKRALIY